eukprot:3686004-Pyramimonas_sp.AAC.1
MRRPTTASPRGRFEREGSRALGQGTTKQRELAWPRRAAALFLLALLGAPSRRGRQQWRAAVLGARAAAAVQGATSSEAVAS